MWFPFFLCTDSALMAEKLSKGFSAYFIFLIKKAYESTMLYDSTLNFWTKRPIFKELCMTYATGGYCNLTRFNSQHSVIRNHRGRTNWEVGAIIATLNTGASNDTWLQIFKTQQMFRAGIESKTTLWQRREQKLERVTRHFVWRKIINNVKITYKILFIS